MQIHKHALEVDLRQLLALLGKTLRGFQEMSPGGNSSLYLLTDSESRTYVGKFYPPPEDSRADRLQVEFTSLAFLRDNGITCIPEPLAYQIEKRQALYSFLPGRRPVDVTGKDVEEMAHFFARIQALRGAPQAETLPLASEACFTVGQHLELLQARVATLAEELLLEDVEVKDFLNDNLLPFLGSLEGALDPGMDLRDRVLSPSDFGFHNCLRGPDGRLSFLDFEYFGWDDLTKTVADFLLHPQHRGLDRLRGRFLEVIRGEMRVTAGFSQRLEQVYPLCGAKWIVIMLNVFLRRRRQATPLFFDLQRQRLGSARELLSHLSEGSAI